MSLRTNNLTGFNVLNARKSPPVILNTFQNVATAEQSSLTRSGHSPTAGTNYVIAAVGWGRNATNNISNVTYGGVGMTQLAIAEDNTGGSTFCGVAFYGIATSSTGNIVFTVNSTTDGMVLWTIDLENVDTGSVVDDSNSGTASGTASKSLSLTSSLPTMMLGMRCVNRVTSSYTPNSGVTEIYDIQHGPGGIGTYFLGNRNSVSAETFSFGCTVGSTADGDAMAVVAISGS